MGAIKEMNPELAAKLIEGFDDELSGESKKLDTFYRMFRCPRCRTDSMQKEVDPRHAFSDGESLVARSLLRCSSCRALIDPHSGIVLEMGRPEIAPAPITRSP